MKSLLKELLDRAVLAMVAAIEIYNKPGFSYRNESFTILAINGWELLLKAKWLDMHDNDKQSLYVHETHKTATGENSKKPPIKKTRSGVPFTLKIRDLATKLSGKQVLNHSVSKNIEILLDFRNSATHFYNEDPKFHTRLYEIGAACVKNFVNAAHEWFELDITKFDVHLMPLTFRSLPTNIEGSLLNAEEKKFLAFLDSVIDYDADPNSPYSVSVNVELKFTKSASSNAFLVKETNDPAALPVTLIEEDILKRYPWDYAKLTAKCRKRYDGFKMNGKYHKIRKGLETDKRFAHSRFLDPKNIKSSKKTLYSPQIMEGLDKHYTKKQSTP
ncbi:MAG: hypothetical protein M2R45_00256 [Verrucomicrobia subdivision 3 bacterium]|nr:hypothetical protein [Limisphaerales bacterium]MCS1412984.1 hypothetical protein [Limisphaerales bacterium]